MVWKLLLLTRTLYNPNPNPHGCGLQQIGFYLYLGAKSLLIPETFKFKVLKRELVFLAVLINMQPWTLVDTKKLNLFQNAEFLCNPFLIMENIDSTSYADDNTPSTTRNSIEEVIKKFTVLVV